MSTNRIIIERVYDGKKTAKEVLTEAITNKVRKRLQSKDETLDINPKSSEKKRGICHK